jgi:hypothetical protein
MLSFGQMPKYEFLNTLTSWFPAYNLKFFTDHNKRWYHKGFRDLTTNIPESVSYLEKIISGYNKVVFIGNSAGAYAALLFGSILNVSTVIAFQPQTLLKNHEALDKNYCDLKSLLNNTTAYHVYGDMSVTDEKDNHHHNHLKNIEGPLNVHTVYRPNLYLRNMRDSGELQQILTGHINGLTDTPSQQATEPPAH